MNAGKQAGWLFVVLISLACMGWYFASSTPVVKLDDQTLATTTDTVITNLSVHQYDVDGKLINFLQTPLISHVPLNNTHWLKEPHIIVNQKDAPAWDIRSHEATSVQGFGQITFSNDVVIQQKNDDQTVGSTIKTEEITYFPKDKLATTEAEVTYEQPGNIVHSKGMKAYLAEKRVQLLSSARGSYVPKQG